MVNKILRQAQNDPSQSAKLTALPWGETNENYVEKRLFDKCWALSGKGVSPTHSMPLSQDSLRHSEHSEESFLYTKKNGGRTAIFLNRAKY
ncbi:MAG: hypothetical protein IJN96_03180 [Clostridia bacterium]|nr:hypothetical protein [Clostridia bacterium]